MNEYIILKTCWLGKEKTRVTLNQRQADNLVAGGFIERVNTKPVKKGDK
jgi:hypothetical protein